MHFNKLHKDKIVAKLESGILQSLNLSYLGKAEENVIKKLSEVWFISFCRI